jgi:hypothetical protein
MAAAVGTNLAGGAAMNATQRRNAFITLASALVTASLYALTFDVMFGRVL